MSLSRSMSLMLFLMVVSMVTIAAAIVTIQTRQPRGVAASPPGTASAGTAAPSVRSSGIGDKVGDKFSTLIPGRPAIPAEGIIVATDENFEALQNELYHWEKALLVLRER